VLPDGAPDLPLSVFAASIDSSTSTDMHSLTAVSVSHNQLNMHVMLLAALPPL
jgi:hypothetical protein